MSLNRVILIGRLGKDPETKNLPNDKTVCTFSIATDESFGDKKHTEWHRIVAWGKTAEIAGKYLEKGREVCVEGRIQTRSWEKDGEKKFATEIVCDRLVLLANGGGERRSETRQQAAAAGADDDIPY